MTSYGAFQYSVNYSLGCASYESFGDLRIRFLVDPVCAWLMLMVLLGWHSFILCRSSWWFRRVWDKVAFLSNKRHFHLDYSLKRKDHYFVPLIMYRRDGHVCVTYDQPLYVLLL